MNFSKKNDEIRKIIGSVVTTSSSPLLWTKQNSLPKENIKSGTKDIVTSPRSNDPDIHTKYEYTDAGSVVNRRSLL
jgi:hypothetical protein